MVRVWSNWLREASACEPAAAGPLARAVFKSVQEEGINDRVPSGKTSSRCN